MGGDEAFGSGITDRRILRSNFDKSDEALSALTGECRSPENKSRIEQMRAEIRLIVESEFDRIDEEMRRQVRNYYDESEK